VAALTIAQVVWSDQARTSHAGPMVFHVVKARAASRGELLNGYAYGCRADCSGCRYADGAEEYRAEAITPDGQGPAHGECEHLLPSLP
jgi:hypothetical protein